MELRKLLNGLTDYKAKGDLDINIKKVESNSKKIVPDSLFVAIKGFDFDGHDYIVAATTSNGVNRPGGVSIIHSESCKCHKTRHNKE